MPQDVDWTFLYQLFPSLVSVVLVAVVRFAERSLKHTFGINRRWNDRDRQFAIEIGVDWNARLGFHSAMLAAFASVVAVATDPFRGWLLATAVGTMVIVWLWVWLRFLRKEHFGEVQEGSFPTTSDKLDGVVILVNLAIVIMLLANQPDGRAAFCSLTGFCSLIERLRLG